MHLFAEPITNTGSTVFKRYFQKVTIMQNMRALGLSCSHCEIAVIELEFACDVANPSGHISEFIMA